MPGNTPAVNIIANTDGSGKSGVAVIIVNYHSALLLRRCLQSLAAQRAEPSKVIIVDNGDDPGALDFVAKNHPDYQLISSQNIGFAAANNLAIRVVAGCEWIALLNPDAFPEADWLQKLLIAAQRNSAVAVFSSRLMMADEPQRIDGDGDVYHFSGLAWRCHHGRNRVLQRAEGWVFSPCAAAAMFRRSALLDVGGFDENFFCYFEDVDLGFRLRLRGHCCLHVPDAVVSHVGGSSSQASGMSDFALYHGHRNLVWTFVKNMPGYLFWVFLPAHLAMNVVSIFWFALHGKGRVILRAKLDALKRLPEVWTQRKLVQSARTIKPGELLKEISFWPRR